MTPVTIPSGAMIDTTGLVEPIDGERASVFLRPGDWLFGRGSYRVGTLLGTCVSVVMWSRRLHTGGICHALLPRRTRAGQVPGPGHYVEESLDWMAASFARQGCGLKGLDISVIGGAKCWRSRIGADNVEAAMQWLDARGLQAQRVDTGGSRVRKLTFDMRQGDLMVAMAGVMATGENQHEHETHQGHGGR